MAFWEPAFEFRHPWIQEYFLSSPARRDENVRMDTISKYRTRFIPSRFLFETVQGMLIMSRHQTPTSLIESAVVQWRIQQLEVAEVAGSIPTAPAVFL